MVKHMVLITFMVKYKVLITFMVHSFTMDSESKIYHYLQNPNLPYL